MGFATAARAAVTDGFGAIGKIAEASGGTGSDLARLEDDGSLREVEGLVARPTVLQAKLKELLEFGL